MITNYVEGSGYVHMLEQSKQFNEKLMKAAKLVESGGNLSIDKTKASRLRGLLLFGQLSNGAATWNSTTFRRSLDRSCVTFFLCLSLLNFERKHHPVFGWAF